MIHIISHVHMHYDLYLLLFMFICYAFYIYIMHVNMFVFMFFHSIRQIQLLSFGMGRVGGGVGGGEAPRPA